MTNYTRTRVCLLLPNGNVYLVANVKFDAITCARLFTCQTAAFLFTIANLEVS